jgi:hypothetical protein
MGRLKNIGTYRWRNREKNNTFKDKRRKRQTARPN